jgi:hypothetical protein
MRSRLVTAVVLLALLPAGAASARPIDSVVPAERPAAAQPAPAPADTGDPGVGPLAVVAIGLGGLVLGAAAHAGLRRRSYPPATT